MEMLQTPVKGGGDPAEKQPPLRVAEQARARTK